MDHLAILRKAKLKKGDNLLKDILLGTKTIESRWYVNKIAPWDKIKIGDTVYFKESGSPVVAKALVSNVLQYSNLTLDLIATIITKYGKYISPKISLPEFLSWGEKQTLKKYCILVFLEKVEEIPPFNIDKTGFGISSAWLVVPDISKIKISI